MRIRALFIVLLTGLVLAMHGLAVAHTDLSATEPEAGSKVKTLESIELYFTTPLESAEVRVLHESEIQPSTTVIDENITHVTTRLDEEPEQGLYQVVWSATSLGDGHTISGSFSFEYDAPPTPQEMRAGIFLLVTGTIAFIVMLIWQRRMAAIKATEKAES